MTQHEAEAELQAAAHDLGQHHMMAAPGGVKLSACERWATLEPKLDRLMKAIGLVGMFVPGVAAVPAAFKAVELLIDQEFCPKTAPTS